MPRQEVLKWIVKFLKVTLGIAIAAFGITLTYKSGLGSSAMSTVSQGVSRVLHIQVGTANMMLNGFFFAIAMLGQKNKIGIGTPMIVFGLGLFINVFVKLLSPVVLNASLNLVINVLGIILNAGGIAIMVIVNFGIGPLELITEMITEKTKWSYRKSKLAFDAMMLILGISLGGDYGIGTIMNVLMFGFIMQFVFEVHKKQRNHHQM